MSLTSLINDNQEFRSIIKTFFDRPAVNKSNILVHTDGQKSSVLVGTALDYIFRFNLKRINASAVERTWISEYYIRMNGETIDNLTFSKEVIAKTKELKNEFTQTGVLDDKLIACCISLAKMDNVFRSGLGSESLREPALQSDMDATRIMFNATDWDLFKSENDTCLLNPAMGRAGSLIGGADADWIIDSRLDDLKTTEKLPRTIGLRDFAQLIGYYALDRINQEDDGLESRIDELSIYYARFGVQCKFKINDVISKNGINDFMDYFRRLIKDYGKDRHVQYNDIKIDNKTVEEKTVVKTFGHYDYRKKFNDILSAFNVVPTPNQEHACFTRTMISVNVFRDSIKVKQYHQHKFQIQDGLKLMLSMLSEYNVEVFDKECDNKTYDYEITSKKNTNDDIAIVMLSWMRDLINEYPLYISLKVGKNKYRLTRNILDRLMPSFY